jgi:hypothetical protein
MTESQNDPGLLGRATSEADDVDWPEGLIAALADLFTNGTPSDCIEFTFGAIEIMRAMAGVLIGSGQFPPTWLQPEIAQRATVWEAKGFPQRALALRSFLDSLKTIEAAVVANGGKMRRPN